MQIMFVVGVFFSPLQIRSNKSTEFSSIYKSGINGGKKFIDEHMIPKKQIRWYPLLLSGSQKKINSYFCLHFSEWVALLWWHWQAFQFFFVFFCITFECCIKRQKHAPANIQKRWHRLITSTCGYSPDISYQIILFFIRVIFAMIHLNEIISSKFDGTWYLCYFCTSLAIGLDFCLEIWVRKKSF